MGWAAAAGSFAYGWDRWCKLMKDYDQQFRPVDKQDDDPQ
jgi:hypothetical protein